MPTTSARSTSVRIGRDFGAEIEILSGVGAQDRIIINPPDSHDRPAPGQVRDQRRGARRESGRFRPGVLVALLNSAAKCTRKGFGEQVRQFAASPSR